MLTFIKADISLHHCDALLFTCVEDFPLRLRGTFGRARTYRSVIETWKSWGPGRIYPQLPEAEQPGQNIIVHADLGSDPESVRSLVTIVNNLKPLAAKIQNGYDTEYIEARKVFDAKRDAGTLDEFELTPVRRKFRSIAMPRIGEHAGYGWAETKKILKMAHSEPNPPENELDLKFHVEVYEVDQEGVPPKR